MQKVAKLVQIFAVEPISVLKSCGKDYLMISHLQESNEAHYKSLSLLKRVHFAEQRRITEAWDI